MIYPKSTIKNISESIGITKLKDDITTAMAQDVEYRLHEVIEEAMKFMRHSKRTKLTVADINSALRVRNIEPIYGFEAGKPVKFHKATAAIEDIYYIEDEQIDLDTLIEEPLPRIPLEVVYTAHWLAIEGVQPKIQQNPIAQEDNTPAPAPSKKQAKATQRQDGVETIALVKHVLSKELQLYFECITSSLQSTDPKIKSTALESISVDAGIHQLVTYFVQYIAELVKNNMHSLETLQTALAISKAIRRNPNLFVEPYMHQLIPSLLTCLVSKKLCKDPSSENHWGLRDEAAEQIAEICQQYSKMYHTLQSRIARTLLRAFLDPTKPLTTHYGAIVGLTRLGVSIIRVLVLPNIKMYMTLLDAEMMKENVQLQRDGRHCQEALIGALKTLAMDNSELDAASLTSLQKTKLSGIVGDTLARAIFMDKDAGKIVAYLLASEKSVGTN